jgi:hypothetical protein
MPENRKERVDRELLELLNELRVVLPGAQVLFAFLLTLPFTPVFAHIDPALKAVYFAAFLCVAAGTALLMAPGTNHRLRFREYDKEQMLFSFNRLAIAGSVFLAVAIALSVFVVADLVVKTAWAAVAAAGSAAWFVWFWYVVPLWHHRQKQSPSDDRPGE